MPYTKKWSGYGRPMNVHIYSYLECFHFDSLISTYVYVRMKNWHFKTYFAITAILPYSWFFKEKQYIFMNFMKWPLFVKIL